MKCLICDYGLIDEKNICSDCKFPNHPNMPDDVRIWARRMWLEKCKNDKLFDPKNSPPSPDTQFKKLEENQNKQTEKIKTLEQIIKKSEARGDVVKKMNEELKKTIVGVQENKKKIESDAQETLEIKSQLSTLETTVEQKLVALLDEKIATFQEERSQTQKQIEDLSAELSEVWKFLKAKQEISTYSNSPTTSSSNQEATPIKTSSDRELSWQEHQLIEKYNKKKESLVDCITVSETKQSTEDRRLGKSQTVILEENRRGNYWIVEQEGMTYLIPSDNLRLNEYNYKTVEAVFECRGYQINISSNFKLKQPAIVKQTTDGMNWQLKKPGILEF
ncbi:MAG: hypothetical protein QNJ42_23095 [Crocosphaera sp.]|nr:hypothetical protein [Crocosphaera sp.]